MSDITKIRDWVDTDEQEPEHGWEWPHPPICVESRVSGDLRRRILAKIGRDAGDAVEVRLIETEIEGGYSEFTVEHDYDIEVWLHEGGQSQKVWASLWGEWTPERALAAFLKWTDDGE